MKNKLNIIAIIPARMNSTRFPGKPLAKINGKPMIGHVYERVAQSKSLNSTVVATCDQEIIDYINSVGGMSVMTSAKHERASDRCAEALIVLEKLNHTKYDIVVMVQGDEPLVKPEMIDEAVLPMLQDCNVNVVNLLGKIKDEIEFNDRNCIKVVCDLNMNAIYFSREPIPTQAKTKKIPMGKQVCVIPFRRDYLIEYNALKPTPLEIVESIDMMRVLENGQKVKMVDTKYQNQAVDTKEDLAKVEFLMQSELTK